MATVLIEDTLGAVLATIIRRWPHLPVEELRELELQIRAQIGGRRVYVARGRDTSRGNAYRQARADGLAPSEAAEAAGISRRHARRLEQRGHDLP